MYKHGTVDVCNTGEIILPQIPDKYRSDLILA